MWKEAIGIPPILATKKPHDDRFICKFGFIRR
jgi:hypothetical protein